MEQNYKMRYTHCAERHIKETLQYLVNNYMSIEDAVGWSRALRELIEKKLEAFPTWVSTYREEGYLEETLMRILVKNHYVYYFVSENTKEVFIVAIIYCMMDQDQALRELNEL